VCVCDRSLTLILNISGIPPAQRLALCVSESGRFGRFLGRRLERQPNYFRRLPEQLLVVRPRERLMALGITSALEPRNTKRALPAKRSRWRDFVAYRKAALHEIKYRLGPSPGQQDSTREAIRYACPFALRAERSQQSIRTDARPNRQSQRSKTLKRSLKLPSWLDPAAALLSAIARHLIEQQTNAGLAGADTPETHDCGRPRYPPAPQSEGRAALPGHGSARWPIWSRVWSIRRIVSRAIMPTICPSEMTGI
jgi:hypothetical protein